MGDLIAVICNWVISDFNYWCNDSCNGDGCSTSDIEPCVCDLIEGLEFNSGACESALSAFVGGGKLKDSAAAGDCPNREVCNAAARCFSDGYAFRNVIEGGRWPEVGDLASCNEATPYCDGCFPDTACPYLPYEKIYLTMVYFSFHINKLY